MERDPHVFSSYNPMGGPARFMIIGQNPGWDELGASTPFVGAAGKNFDAELTKSVWTRANFYITNAVKCFSPGNRPPTTQEAEACEPFLRMELAILKPKLVIAFGSVAFSALCEGGFSDRIGHITTSSKFGVRVFTTYHPSPRNLSNASRRKQFEHDIGVLVKIMNYFSSPF